MQIIQQLVIDPLDATWVVIGICAGVTLGYAIAKLTGRRSE